MSRPSVSPRLVAVALLVAAIAAVGIGVAVAGADAGTRYRTAVATTGRVTRTLQGAGTVTPVDRVSVSFPTSGTVKSVEVAPGQHVKLGQALASLDPTSLQDAVDSATVSLTQAQLTLAQAEAGQLSATQLANAGSGNAGSGFGGSGSGSGSGSSGGSGSGRSNSVVTTGAALASATAARVVPLAATVPAAASASPPAGGTSLQAQIAAAQRKLLELQKRLDAAMTESSADVAAAVQACGGDSTDPTSTTTTTTTLPGGDCLTAQQTALDQLAAVASLERQVGAAIATLDDLLRRAAATSPSGSSGSGSTGGSATSSGRSGRPSTGGSASGTQGSSGASGASGSSAGIPTAAQVAALQAAVDSAQAKLAATKQSLAAATIVSPLDGTVTAVGLAPGSSVSASSSSQAVIVAGAGGFEVSTDVGAAQRSLVSVGERATVTPDSTGKPVSGAVVAIDVAGQTSGTTTSYTVVIALAHQVRGLRDGAAATTAITLSAETDPVVVPTSAVHTAGTRHTVTVLEGGRTRSVTVRLGTVSATTTAVTSGLRAGQVVVLADLSEPLPSSASTAITTNRFGGFGGGPGGVTGFRGFGGRGGSNAGN